MPDTISIPANINGLIEASEKILSPKSSKPVLDCLKQRKKWMRIQNEYQEMKKNGWRTEDAVRSLSKKHFYSEKSIEAILYSR